MSGPLCLGADLGGTNFRAALVDGSGRVLALERAPAPRDAGPARTIETVAGLLAAAERGRGPAACAGVAAAGPLDWRTGRLFDPPNLPGLARVDLGPRLAERLGRPVFVENDANAFAYAEHRCGAGQGARSLVALTLGTGVGGGIVIDGRLHRGAHGTAAELGHTVVAEDGPPCGCGGRGCLETFASATAVLRDWRQGLADGSWPPPAACDDPARASTADLFAWAREGDRGSRCVFERAGRRLGRAVASFVNALDPERVILGGGMAGAAPVFLPALREAFEEQAVEPARSEVAIEVARLGGEAGVIGAALLAAERLAEER